MLAVRPSMHHALINKGISWASPTGLSSKLSSTLLATLFDAGLPGGLDERRKSSEGLSCLDERVLELGQRIIRRIHGASKVLQ